MELVRFLKEENGQRGNNNNVTGPEIVVEKSPDFAVEKSPGM